MDTNDRINEAIAAGEKNKATIELVRNWCRHARIEAHGGQGLVQMQTGLPIGHHSIACEHAVAGGMFAWDLADAVLDFHDRNCVNCTHRQPVRLPNVAILVADRDARNQRAQEEDRARRETIEAARSRRREMRQSLRVRLPAPAAGVLDCLEDLDQDQSGTAAERFVASATLAPEAFAPELIEHLFSMLEADEEWCTEATLQVLRRLKADGSRLIGCAMRCLARHSAVSVAAELVEEAPHLVAPEAVSGAVLALSNLANPEHAPMSYSRTENPGPLRALHRQHTREVELAIEKLIDHRSPRRVSLGAGALAVLAEEDSGIAARFARTLTAKLAGAKWLIDARKTGYLGEDQCITRLQDALALALRQAPKETDAMIGHFLNGVAGKDEARLMRVYCRVLQPRGDWGKQAAALDPAAPAALRRLVAAVASQRNDEVLREILGTLAHSAEDHSDLAQQELTVLLGAAVLIDDELKRVDAETSPSKDWLAQMERQTSRQQRLSLQGILLQWAAAGARGSAAHSSQYIDVLAGIPEERDELRSAMIENMHALMQTPEGLNLALPCLYTALVGASQRVRAAAARAIGGLQRRGHDDLPRLVYEAFTTLLLDSFVIVHQSAVEALEKVQLPEGLNRDAHTALTNLIHAYHTSRKDDRFLLRCIRLYLRRYAAEEDNQREVGRVLVAMMEPIDADVVIPELRWLRHHLGELPEFASLVTRLLAHPTPSESRQEDIIRTLGALPAAAIQLHKAKIAEVPAKEAGQIYAAHIVEILTRAGAWDEAVQVSDAVYANIPSTTEYRPQKLHANLDCLATRFEQALARGRLEDIPRLAAQWRSTVSEIDEDRTRHAQQRRPFPYFPGAD